MRPIQIIGAASCAGAPDPGCAGGPDALRDADVLPRLRGKGIELSWRTTLYPRTAAAPLPLIQDLCEHIAREVSAASAAGALPLVVGGDHSCAVGTWSGAFVALRQRGPLGLIWVDAHMDSHTPQTSHSGAIHGMPVAALLGHGAPELVNVAFPGPKLLPSHLCLVGVRSFEEEEAQLLQHLGVRVFFMQEVARRGIASVMAEALDIARNGTAGFGISVDLDAFSPSESPGVSTPVRDGLRHLELDQVLNRIAELPDLVALELAEYNPRRDPERLTLKLIGELLDAVFEGD